MKFILFIICYYFAICSKTKLRFILFVIIGFHDISGSHFFYFIIIIFYYLHDITYSYAIFSYVHQNSFPSFINFYRYIPHYFGYYKIKGVAGPKLFKALGCASGFKQLTPQIWRLGPQIAITPSKHALFPATTQKNGNYLCNVGPTPSKLVQDCTNVLCPLRLLY